MSSSPFKLRLRNVLKTTLFTRISCLVPRVILLLFAGLLSSTMALAASAANRPVPSLGPGLQFAIADFDGDVRPDLASIRAGSSSAGNTNYWIQLQLSTAGQQFIQLVAPAGGLRIEARDVNGDHAPDLVFATAWLSQPVAIKSAFGRGMPTTSSQIQPGKGMMLLVDGRQAAARKDLGPITYELK